MKYLIVPNWVIRLHAEHNISAGSVICFIFLLNRCNDGKYQLYMDEIAEGCGMSKRQAARYIKDLISAGLIERHRSPIFGDPFIYRIVYLQDRQGQKFKRQRNDDTGAITHRPDRNECNALKAPESKESKALKSDETERNERLKKMTGQLTN